MNEQVGLLTRSVFKGSMNLKLNRCRGACRQAERKSLTSTHVPDLDNANVGNLK